MINFKFGNFVRWVLSQGKKDIAFTVIRFGALKVIFRHSSAKFGVIRPFMAREIF